MGEVIRKFLKLKFTVGPVRDDKYIIAKLKIFNRINRTTFTDNAIPIERNHYTCIPAIDIDSVLKIDNKRAYPHMLINLSFLVIIKEYKYSQCYYLIKHARSSTLIASFVFFVFK